MYYTHVFLLLLLLLLQLISSTTGQEPSSSSKTTQHTTDIFQADNTAIFDSTSTITTTTETQTSTPDASTNPVNQDVYNSKDLFTQPPKITDVSSTLQINFYCEIDTSFCQKVQTAFISAMTKFSQVVNLKNKIVIQATYYSFCLNKCSNSTFGWGTPSSQFTLISLTAADSNFIYPQPLARQLAQITDSSNWADYDVSIDINHDIYMNAVNYDVLTDIWNGQGVPPGGGFWFNDTEEVLVPTGNTTTANVTNVITLTPTPTSTNTTVTNATTTAATTTTTTKTTTTATLEIPTPTNILDTQVDLEYVILHQLIHGLGMVSSWAPYFSDTNSPFEQLLSGLITPSDSLKLMTPSPYWYIKEHTGPAYITGFQANMIFDKFLNLFVPSLNQTVNLVDYSFDMQNFCVDDQDAFIVNFMNLFLNNATQSNRANDMYVSMLTTGTLSFIFNTNYYFNNNTSAYYTNSWLNETYETIQLQTGPSIFASSQQQYYRPGISTSHVDDQYVGTPDFLMTNQFIKGKTLQALIDEAYTNIPDISYNITTTIFVNITTMEHNTTIIGSGHNVTTNTTYYNVTTLEQQQVQVNTSYKSAIGPGILRILETIGYSTVLTNTNYSTGVIKTTKPETTCTNNNNNLNSRSTSDDPSSDQPLSSTVSLGVSYVRASHWMWCIIVSINVLLFSVL